MTARWSRTSVAFAAALGLGCFAASTRRAPPAPLAPAAALPAPARQVTGKQACLECHGPFDQLAERTSGYQAPSGETGTPHRYVPHREPEEREIPECIHCHQVHPVPPSAGDLAALRKPTVTWCYERCHHTKDFTPCKACHPGYDPAPAGRITAAVGPGRRRPELRFTPRQAHPEALGRVGSDLR